MGIHSTSNASKQSSGKKSSNPSNRSFESEKIMVKHDPLNAFAPGINNDAIAKSFESDYAAKRRLMMEEATLYEQNMVEQYEDQFPHQFNMGENMHEITNDVAMHQEHAYYDENCGMENYGYGNNNNFGNGNNYGNNNSSYQNSYGNQYQGNKYNNKTYNRTNTNSSFPKTNKKQQFDWNSLPDEHPLKIFKTGRCQKASDFLEKHSVEKTEENVEKHLSHIESIRRNMRKCCKNERNSMSRAQMVDEKLRRVKNFNKSSTLSFSNQQRDSVSTLNETSANSKDVVTNHDKTVDPSSKNKAVTEFKQAIQRSCLS